MKNTYFQILLNKYRNKGIVIDSNLLVLYIIGCYNSNLIKDFSKTKQFTIEELYFLNRIINIFPFNVTTPNILTEVNCLINDLDINIIS